MAQDSILDLSRLAISASPRVHILSLPEDILLQIFSECDLRTISRLSRTCRAFNQTIRSDKIWRRICKSLVGPWIHRSNLISKQIPKSHRPKDAPIPPDWTKDPACFPASHFAQSACPTGSESQSKKQKISSWYHFAVNFLIPHFNCLGWHVSNQTPNCQMSLVRYDVFSGQIIFETVECANFFDPIHDQPKDPTVLGLPQWISMPHIHLEPEGLHYRISSNPGPVFEIFAPMYSLSKNFTISPDTSNLFVAHQSLSKEVYDWEDFNMFHYEPKVRHAERLIVPRSDIRFESLVSQEVTDFITNLGQGPRQLHLFAYGNYLNFPIDGPINSNIDQPRRIDHGLWVGVSFCSGSQHDGIEFGKFCLEKHCNGHVRIQFLRITGGRQKIMWYVGSSEGKRIPAISLDEALADDFCRRSMRRTDSWVRAMSSEVFSGQEIHVQFIIDPEVGSTNGLFPNHIRVKWQTFNIERPAKVTSYFRVPFD